MPKGTPRINRPDVASSLSKIGVQVLWIYLASLESGGGSTGAVQKSSLPPTD